MRPKRWMRSSVQVACVLLGVILATRAEAQEADAGAPAGSFRAAQDQGLDFSLRPVDLLNVDPGGAPPGSYRAAQDISRRDAWSRGVRDGWSGPGVPPSWAGGRDMPLDSSRRF
jgi:hypothetical protein